MLVKNFYNKNQFVIETGDKDKNIYFQSYETIIARFCGKTQKLYINYNMWDYSKTTLKHLYLFLNDYVTMFYYKFVANSKNKKQTIKQLIKDSKILISTTFKI